MFKFNRLGTVFHVKNVNFINAASSIQGLLILPIDYFRKKNHLIYKHVEI